MRFFRENSSLITRLFINQIGMTIFGLVLTTAVMRAADNNQTLTVTVSIFSVLFYLFLIYNVMWEEGARNIVRINAGRLDADPLFALRASLLACVPNLVLGALLLVSFLLGYLGNFAFAQTVYTVLHIILGLFEAMYVGLFSVLLGMAKTDMLRYFIACVLYLLSSLPMILVSLGAYALGKHNVYLFGKRKGADKK